MKKIIINGIYLSIIRQLTGIPRYCKEIILRLDKLLHNEDLIVEYAYLKGAPNKILPLNELKNIRPVCIPSNNKRVAYLFTLPKYVKEQGGICVSLSPDPIRCKNHIACIHDLRPAIFNTYDSWHFKISYRFTLMVIRKNANKIVTVSDYQNNAICTHLKIKNKKNVVTIYNGWEHMQDIEPDESIFSEGSKLLKGEYYYALGSLAPHKNFKWVIEVAKRNPDTKFVVAGGKNLRNWTDDIQTDAIENLVFLGYVSDGQNKALMQSCKAFLHPSKYEGFGIPPLEALSCGASVAVAKSTCLPEVYEDCVHYFDPDDYEVDLERLLTEPVSPPQKILAKCSWEKSAQQWLDLIKEELAR